MQLPKLLPVVLPTIHIIFCAVSAIAGEKVASGGNPFVCVDLPFSLPLVAREDSMTVIIVAVLATAWWYFIGQIGWSSNQGRMSRFGSALGALLVGFIIAADSFLMISQFSLIFSERNFGAVDVVIYSLAALLLSGGVVSATYSALAAFGVRTR
jgi:hypothetical protein